VIPQVEGRMTSALLQEGGYGRSPDVGLALRGLQNLKKRARFVTHARVKHRKMFYHQNRDP